MVFADRCVVLEDNDAKVLADACPLPALLHAGFDDLVRSAGLRADHVAGGEDEQS
ncbi:hypothetical protein [Microbacterium aoyamense]|uniref:hypothetical protein n=1 Tax=Microbacterium aoyamense TaxID=344166 RepID=UPI002002FAFB|nr:hypothetical protein [Microbacterium aoyamense]